MFDRLRTRLDAGRQDGFTLIELLIVIVILGILAGIVVFAVGGISDRGTNSACKSDLKSVEVATEAYFAKKKSYPTAIGGTDATTLVGAKLLKSAPASTDYAIALDSTTGAVTASYGSPATAGCPA